MAEAAPLAKGGSQNGILWGAVSSQHSLQAVVRESCSPGYGPCARCWEHRQKLTVCWGDGQEEKNG